MEANRNNDIVHAKNSLKIFEKKKAPKPTNESGDVQGQSREIQDDVRMIDISEDQGVDERIQGGLPSASSKPTKDKTTTNVEMTYMYMEMTEVS